MAAEDSIRRFERIVAILIQLQSKRIVRAQDVANRFEVSLRTVYRDIRSLESAGVPIYSEPGVGYSLVDGYKLPPVMFTQEEAGTFVAAEKLMVKFMDEKLGRHFASAMFKIKSALKDDQKDRLEVFQSNIRIDPSERLFNDVPDVLEILFEGIAEKRQVVLTYQSVQAEEAAERLIEPVGVFHEHNNWYLVAFCHTRNTYRNFRTDRVHGIRRTTIPFVHTHKTLDHYLRRDQPTGELPIVRLRVDKSAVRFLKWDRKYFGFESEIRLGDHVEMTFRCDYVRNGFARWFLMFADQVDILEPEELKKSVEELMGKIVERGRK
jgi:predicted DNA-binding transcriptional regulator YafY